MSDPPYGASLFELEQVGRCIRGQKSASVYMEIGSLAGGSLRAFGGTMPAGSLLIGVDRPKAGDYRADLLTAASDLRAGGYGVKLVFGNSREPETIREAIQALGSRPIDVLFVDGDHTGFGVHSDFHNYLPRVSNGGLVIMHDVGPALRAADGSGIRENQYRNTLNCFAAWCDLASRYHRKMIVQEHSGYGLVWLDK